MGLDLEIGDEASVFSARTIRARLHGDPRPVVASRATLEWGMQRLYSLFQEGEPAASLVRARAFLVDEVLRDAWQRFGVEGRPDLALIAVGGYGRGELLPHSDVDVLILHEPERLEPHKPQLEQFLQFLWDIGLEVGSSVRTVAECLALAAADITVITNLMESRLVTGAVGLHEELLRGMGPDRMWPVDRFFAAKLEEQRRRHQKFDETGYKLEPNIKESPGGLRDIHTIAWVAKRHFGAQTLGELQAQGFLTAQESSELFAGQDFLWRVRFALHMLTGRHEDRLLFDHQIKAADLFGYQDDNKNRAVEQFMQLYYRTIKSLSCLNDMLLQLFEEAILQPDPDEAPRVLNRRFQVRSGFIEARSDDVFRRAPFALIEIFLLLQQNADVQGIRAETLRLLRRDRKIIDAPLREDLQAKRLFIQMFREPQGLTRALRRMNRYGVLGRYLPAFGRVIGHMQYDLFHTLTVDEHSLYVVRNLRRMSVARFRDELPFQSQLMGGIAKKELLYLAALFHDMAKGQGGDHSELGAVEARAFCLDHGLSHADADLVAWLVRNHLLMSLTAQKQDVSDPQVVLDFARKIGDRARLDYLFLLTCADIRGTNPALWNAWRATLLQELYLAAAKALDRGLHNPVSLQERAAEQKHLALGFLAGSGIRKQQAELVWRRFEDEYFLRHSPEEIAWQLPALREATDAALPLILVQPFAARGTTVFIYTRDRDYLFALTTGVLAQLGLNILDARLNTTGDGYVLDSYVVMEEDGNPVNGQMRQQEICQALRRVIGDPDTRTVEVTRRTSRRLRHFDTPTTVYIAQDQSRGRTILEIVTADQPGLLSLIGRIFQSHGILLDAAKIATIGERAEDVFYITDRNHRAITDPSLLDQLRTALERSLSRAENASSSPNSVAA